MGGAWQPDRSGRVKVEILGPRPGATVARPQVAAELSATTQLVESGIWVDGTELLAKGGGLTPTRGTIYGAPSAPLAPGKHRRGRVRAHRDGGDRGRVASFSVR